MAEKMNDVKVASPAKEVTKEKLNILPAFKLAAVGAITAGAIAALFEVTKDKIADNQLQLALSSYNSMGEKLTNWNNSNTKGLSDIYTVTGKGSVKKYVAYCTDVAGPACKYEKNAAGDALLKEGNVVALGLQTIADVSGYGIMTMNILVDINSKIIKAWDQLGFVTSFGEQTKRTLASMNSLIGQPISAQFTTNASTVKTTAAISTQLADMASFIASFETIQDQLVAAFGPQIDDFQTLTGVDPTTIPDGDIVETGDRSMPFKVKLPGNKYLFLVKYDNTWVSRMLAFVVNADGTVAAKTTVDDRYYLTSDGFGDRTVDHREFNRITDFNSFPTFTFAGSTTADTHTGLNNLVTKLGAAWADKDGGF